MAAGSSTALSTANPRSATSSTRILPIPTRASSSTGTPSGTKHDQLAAGHARLHLDRALGQVEPGQVQLQGTDGDTFHDRLGSLGPDRPGTYSSGEGRPEKRTDGQPGRYGRADRYETDGPTHPGTGHENRADSDERHSSHEPPRHLHRAGDLGEGEEPEAHEQDPDGDRTQDRRERSRRSPDCSPGRSGRRRRRALPRSRPTVHPDSIRHPPSAAWARARARAGEPKRRGPPGRRARGARGEGRSPAG